jgi:hypothetical protein
VDSRELHLGQVDVVGVVGEAGKDRLDSCGELLEGSWRRRAGGVRRIGIPFWHWLAEAIFWAQYFSRLYSPQEQIC